MSPLMNRGVKMSPENLLSPFIKLLRQCIRNLLFLAVTLKIKNADLAGI